MKKHICTQILWSWYDVSICHTKGSDRTSNEWLYIDDTIGGSWILLTSQTAVGYKTSVTFIQLDLVSITTDIYDYYICMYRNMCRYVIYMILLVIVHIQWYLFPLSMSTYEFLLEKTSRMNLHLVTWSNLHDLWNMRTHHVRKKEWSDWRESQPRNRMGSNH